MPINASILPILALTRTETTNTSFTPVYICLIAVIAAIIAANNARLREYIKIRNTRRRGNMAIPKALTANYLGRPCMLATGNFGGNIAGTISAVEENWLQIKTNQGEQLVNSDFVVSIRPLKDKEIKRLKL